MTPIFTWRFVPVLGLAFVGVLFTGTPMPIRAGDKAVVKQTVTEETKKLQGDWKQVKMILDGKETKEEIAKQFSYRFDGSRYTNSRNGKTISEGTFSLDPSKKPSEMDVVEKNGTKLFATYSLAADTIIICFHEQTRPDALESRKGQRRLLVVLERAK